MTLRRYSDSVFGWSRFQPERGYEFNGTALPGPEGNVLLVDPVPATDGEKAELRGLGSRFTVVLTTSDHERDSAQFARDFGANVRVSRLDAPFLRAPGASPFESGETLPGGWIVQELTAMKTPGESVLFHPDKKILVIGDAVIADPSTGLRLVPPAKLPDRVGALRSLAALARLDFDALFVGDGFVLPSGGREALKRFLAKEGVKVNVA